MENKITAGFEVITPEDAKRMLEHNINNRPIKEKTVQMYASDMIHGDWDEESPGNSLVFDSEGNLQDGQHRLLAVIRANRPIKFFVIRGVAPKPHIYDMGVKRSSRDILTMQDEKFANMRNGALAVANITMNIGAGIVKPSVAQQRKFLQHEDFFQKSNDAVTISRTGRPKLLRKALCQFAFFEALNFGIPFSTLSTFAEVCNTGCAMGEEQTSALVLRRLLEKKISDNHSSGSLYASATEQAILDFYHKKPRKAFYKFADNDLRKYFIDHEAKFIKTLV